MRKALVFVGLWFIVWQATGQGGLELTEIRQLFLEAGQETKAIEPAYDQLRQIDKDEEPLLVGYRGVLTAMMAQKAVSPVGKYRYFNQGRDLLEDAIEREPEEIELRGLRLILQNHSPAFLGYRTNLEEDKGYILRHLQTSLDWKSNPVMVHVSLLLVSSDLCTAEEKSVLAKKL